MVRYIPKTMANTFTAFNDFVIQKYLKSKLGKLSEIQCRLIIFKMQGLKRVESLLNKKAEEKKWQDRERIGFKK